MKPIFAIVACGFSLASISSLVAQSTTKTAEQATFTKPMPLDAERIRAAGLREIVGKHLTLYTDLPATPAVEELPRVFDAAVPQWAKYFQVDPGRIAQWRMHGFLIKDIARFRAAGVVPNTLPDFKNGFAIGADLWFYEQPSDYYRRHLLLHEGTHGFMNTLLGDCGPSWFMEGVAELEATHRWNPAAPSGEQLLLGYVPRNREEVPALGRIATIKVDLQAGRFRRIGDLVNDSVRGFTDVESYAWCWALAMFLDRHPRYQGRFRTLQAELLGSHDRFNAEFRKRFAGEAADLNREWSVFAHELEYGVDVPRSAIDFRSGSPLAATGAKVSVAADRGWQSADVKLEAGKKYQVRASGRYQIAAADGKPWPCEPAGITIRYFRGRPLGMLLGAVEPDAFDAAREPAMLRPIEIGLETTLVPSASGTLYLRVNDSNGELQDNSGSLSVEISPIP
ncbi:MAG: hypothetical protein K8U03_12515 [Planctomycetia bacterium]|nr:hypothetical protein [Planctomycetia bacterium]